MQRRMTEPRGAVPPGPVSLTVMRAMIAAADELRLFLADSAPRRCDPSELTRAGTELADLVRRYQGASRQLLRDWLQNPRHVSWLVDSASGRVLDVVSSGVSEDAVRGEQLHITAAEDQPLHGLRRRFSRPGIGIPVVLWRRRPGPEQAADFERYTAARARTAVISVEPDFDRRVRAVRILFKDPAADSVFTIGGAELPFAADFTAPVAQTIGRERRPAANAYGARELARRGTVDGFIALTPHAPELAPLVLMEGAGLSPIMMAQVANEVAGDSELRRRFQVWLYRFPMVAPLFFAASQFRADLERFYGRLEASCGCSLAGRGTVIAHGPGTVLAKTLLLASGTALWDGAFTSPIDRLDVRPPDRALLDALFFWTPSVSIGRVIVVSEPRNAEALTAGVGARALQLLQRQPPALRAAIERIYGSQRQYLRPVALPSGATTADGPREAFADEPVAQAIAGAALGADRALLDLVAAEPADERAAAVFARSGGLAPVEVQVSMGSQELLGPDVLRRIGAWLRPAH
jgi:hypothetical protein